MIDNIDLNKIVVSNKVSFGKQDFKYFIGYKDAKKVGLYAYVYSFQKCNAYRRDFDETKYMFDLIKNDEMVEKYNEIWEKRQQ